jgi:hypothetical protein
MNPKNQRITDKAILNRFIFLNVLDKMGFNQKPVRLVGLDKSLLIEQNLSFSIEKPLF